MKKTWKPPKYTAKKRRASGGRNPDFGTRQWRTWRELTTTIIHKRAKSPICIWIWADCLLAASMILFTIYNFNSINSTLTHLNHNERYYYIKLVLLLIRNLSAILKHSNLEKTQRPQSRTAKRFIKLCARCVFSRSTISIKSSLAYIWLCLRNCNTFILCV